MRPQDEVSKRRGETVFPINFAFPAQNAACDGRRDRRKQRGLGLVSFALELFRESRGPLM
jgi:hypothetical protein